jgi:hypothetical protein
MKKGEYEVLSNVVHPKGTGILNLTSTLVKRDGKLCMYERSDEIWEVFLVQTMGESEFRGTHYPPHELYPGNEDFGRTAWCFSTRERADHKYDRLTHKRGSQARRRSTISA